MQSFSSRIRASAVAVLVAAFSVVAPAAHASVACLQSDWETQVKGTGSSVVHPNILGGTGVFAGTFHGMIDNLTMAELYCVDINHSLCFPACYSQGPDVASPEIVWILNHYYPAVPSEPASLSSTTERAQAVQLALWHFSDGIDISSGGAPSYAFDAARAIIAAASSATVAPTPTTLTVSPSSSVHAQGTSVTITATLRDQNGNLMSGVPVTWEVTGANSASGSGSTNASGEVTATYTGAVQGDDQVAFHVTYTIPVGLHWLHDGCQSLVMGSSTQGQLTQIALVSWQPSTPVRATTWGSIKARYVAR